MDMMMPKMDGLTACHIIKTDPMTKATPIIMVTAIGFELNIKLSQQMGRRLRDQTILTPGITDKITEVMTNSLPSEQPVLKQVHKQTIYAISIRCLQMILSKKTSVCNS